MEILEPATQALVMKLQDRILLLEGEVGRYRAEHAKRQEPEPIGEAREGGAAEKEQKK